MGLYLLIWTHLQSLNPGALKRSDTSLIRINGINTGLIKMFQQTNEGICFPVNVIPKAFRSEVIEWENGELKIRLAAVPEKGKANNELIRYLADFLGIGKSKIKLLKGEASRHKRVCITEMTLEEIQAKIQGYLANRK